MCLEFSPAVDADLVAIASFIARDNVPRAVTFVDELEAPYAKLIDSPHSGGAVRTFARDCDPSRTAAIRRRHKKP